MLMLPRTHTQAAVIFSFPDEFRRYPSFRTSLSAVPWLSETLLINLLPQSSIFRVQYFSGSGFSISVVLLLSSHSLIFLLQKVGRSEWAPQTPGCPTSLSRSPQKVWHLSGKNHFVHIYFAYLQCKINYRLQRNPVIFLGNQNILKALVVSGGHVSQLSLLIFRSSSLLCLRVNFKKFAITSPPADRFCPRLHRGQK